MSTPLKVPEITVVPSDIPSGEPGSLLYAWRMQLHEDAVLNSEDHGDEFDSIEEALVHAYGVFTDLVERRHSYPGADEQEFKLTIRKR